MADDMVSQIINNGANSARAAQQRIQNAAGMAQNVENFMVKRRMNDIMRSYNDNGQSFDNIDPKLTSDYIGLQAMGQVSSSLAKTKEYQNNAFKQSLVNANNKWQMAMQYNSDIDKAVKDNDQGRATALMSSFVSQMGAPYRVTPNPDGTMKMTFLSPDGERDMGDMSLVDMWKQLKQYTGNQESFIKAHVGYEMTNRQINAELQGNPQKWLMGVDPKSGRTLYAIPHYNMDNGEVEYFVPGMGNLTPNQLSSSGIQNRIFTYINRHII